MILSLIHPKLLQDCQAYDQALKEGCQVQMEPTMYRSIPHFEEASHHYTLLTQPNIDKPFDMYCDASGTDIGGILMQDGCAIVYASR
jgi:hypothetical protein